MDASCAAQVSRLRNASPALISTSRSGTRSTRRVGKLQQRLAKLLVQVPGTVYQFRLRPDGSSCFPYASPVIADICSITPELAQTDSPPSICKCHPEDLEALRSSILESARTLELWSHEWRQC